MDTKKERIVFVDDNITILRCFKILLQDEPYEILTFNNPLDALEELKKTDAAIVISNQCMPEMEGAIFLEKVREILPDTVRILMIGYADTEAAMAAINKANIFHFIRKPFDIDELDLIIRNAMEHYRLVIENKRLTQVTEKQNEELDKLSNTLKRQVEKQIKQFKQDEGKLEKTLAKVRKMLGAVIQTMQLIIETRDPYTAGHQRRVANLARAIATEMGLSTNQIDGIRIAGVIHDLGKIYEPEEILNKPGRLTDTEFELIKTHPKAGYDLLKHIEFSWPVASIVLQHHERMDGSGYPQGISGDEILLESRILAVADVVEAMVSHRPYRAAHSIDEALEEIAKNRGTLYYPQVVDTCLKLFHEKGFVLN